MATTSPMRRGTFDRIVVTAAMEQIPEKLLEPAGARRDHDRAGRAASWRPEPGPAGPIRGASTARTLVDVRFVPALPGIGPRTLKDRMAVRAKVLPRVKAVVVLGTCLLKTVVWLRMMRTMSRVVRVASLAPGSADRGPGADGVWGGRLQSADTQTRFSQGSFPIAFASQGHRFGYRPRPLSAANCRNMQGRLRRRLRCLRRNPIRSRTPACPAADGGSRPYAPPKHPQWRQRKHRARNRSRRPGNAPHRPAHHHRRHQRYAGDPGQALQRFGRPQSCRPTATRVPRTLSPAKQLIIPRPTTTAAAPAPAVAATCQQAGWRLHRPVHVVNRGRHAQQHARAANHVARRPSSRRPTISTFGQARIGMKITVPGARSAAVELRRHSRSPP